MADGDVLDSAGDVRVAQGALGELDSVVVVADLALKAGEGAEYHADLSQVVLALEESERDLARLGNVFGARSVLEARLGHYDDAVEFQERHLRYAYLTGQIEDIFQGHHNLAIYLDQANRAPEVALAHDLAAVVVAFQAHSGQLASYLAGLRRSLAREGGPALLPASFQQLCERVERVPGVPFRELFQRLHQRAPDGDTALAQVLELAAQLPNPDADIERHPANLAADHRGRPGRHR